MKKLILPVAAVLTAITCTAAPLTPEEALSRVLPQTPSKVAGKPASRFQLAITRSDNNVPTLYLFRNADNGFILTSADDDATLLLGYGDSPALDAEGKVPEAFEAWMDQLSRQVAYTVKEDGIRRTFGKERPARNPIAPLCKTAWNQGEPYNLKCPKKGSELSVTGCVATAMAQVMKYHNWPDQAVGRVSYQWRSGGRTLSMNLEKQTLDWDRMLDRYTDASSEDEKLAVALLMRAVGFAVHMDYSPTASGSYSLNIGPALTEHFKYDKGMKYLHRDYYSLAEWEEIIYNSLRDFGPVIYGGQAMIGGHSFVCDGYDTDGYFHFNWGWGGVSDGYFLLDALDPEVQGIGGADSAFNFMQDIVADIRPDRSGTSDFIGEIILSSPLRFTGDWRGLEPEEGEELPVLTNGELTFPNYFPIEGFSYNPGPGSFTDGYVGVAIDLYGDTRNNAVEYPHFTYNEFHDDNLDPGYGYDGIVVLFPELPDGTYIVRPAYALGKEPSKWSYMRTPLNDSPGLILTIADGLGTFAQETRDLPELTELEIPTEFGNRDKIQIKGIWTLPGDAPFYSTYYPVLLSGKNLAGIGTPGIVDLEADGTAALDITTVFTTQNGGTVQPGKYEFYIAVTDSQRGLYSVSDPIEITLSESSVIDCVGTDTDIIETEYFAPDGTRLADKPARGMYLEITRHADGSRTVYKRI